MGLVDLIDKIKKCLELGVEVDKDGYVTKKEDIYDSLFKEDYGYVPYDYKECYVIDGDEEYDNDVQSPHTIHVEDDDDIVEYNHGDEESKGKISRSNKAKKGRCIIY